MNAIKVCNLSIQINLAILHIIHNKYYDKYQNKCHENKYGLDLQNEEGRKYKMGIDDQ